ncbi:hypothetical protein [Mycolicibacterium vaccae]|uniref:hypothetical protein n=1 Tax=Mycolicibacterium vaccae TaxID=1810 RepID=UPI003D0087C1
MGAVESPIDDSPADTGTREFLSRGTHLSHELIDVADGNDCGNHDLGAGCRRFSDFETLDGLTRENRRQVLYADRVEPLEEVS